MASIILRSLFGAYLVIFALILALNLTIGPVTPALAFMRALLWPIWIATGYPQGVVTVYG